MKYWRWGSDQSLQPLGKSLTGLSMAQDVAFLYCLLAAGDAFTLL
jgi:hypothetical protein